MCVDIVLLIAATKVDAFKGCQQLVLHFYDRSIRILDIHQGHILGYKTNL